MGASERGLVIVGGGLASARAIKSYREHGGDGPVTLVSGDRVVPYHRPPLSKKFLRGEAEVDDTLVEKRDFYEQHGVELRLETHVSALKANERELVLGDGGAIGFDRLLIASGATPRRLDVPGMDLQNVFTLRTVDNSARIREASSDPQARQAVVVGAGVIGMAGAASLAQRGLEVTLVHRGKGLFEILRARALELFLIDLYGRNNVELVLGDEVAEFGGHDAVDSVRTKRGRVEPADLVVVGIGVEPETRWLEGSGLELDNGVVVNERFETGVDGIWAVGDVARFYDPIFERQRRIEHWSNANYQGTEVGKVIAGSGSGYDTVSTFFTEVFGITLKVFGDVDVFDEIVFRGRLEDGAAIGFYLAGDRLVATLATGQDEDTENRLKELIRAHARVRSAERLADEQSPVDAAF